jgi:para-aminobenzoate synthetase component I
VRTATTLAESITLEDWRRWQQQGCNRLPFIHAHPETALPKTWRNFTGSPASVLLESARSGRFTYLCDRPERVILGHATHAEIWSGDFAERHTNKMGKPLDVLAGIFSGIRTPPIAGLPPMTGGMIGVFGYDVVHTWENLPLRARRDLALPLYAMIETAELFVYDHVERTLQVAVWSDAGTDDEAELARKFQAAQTAAANATARWRAGGGQPREGATNVVGNSPASRDGMRASEFPASLSSSEFQAAARRALAYIAAGDTYQVNLSRRTSRATSLSPAAIYEALRQVNPSPYMGLLRLPTFALVCGSPELLVRLVDGVVSSRPIAGTRPRGDAALPDSHFSAELLASEKERAEHLMLVDLIRNDIGRVAEFGSVKVPEFMVLERYSHVMHIVSQVEGRLAAGKTWADVLRAMFPGGTITGCPKFRTMEIIEELEPVGRGYYTGALGWISYGGAMEMNIVIRSMLVQDGFAHVQAGAGIVADSQPDRELDEATRKAQALWVALEKATEHHGER